MNHANNCVNVKLLDNAGYCDEENEIENELNFYTLNELPGQMLIIVFECDCMESKIEFSTKSITKIQVENLINAMARKDKYNLIMQPGPNQEVTICTENGFTTFKQYGDETTAHMSITLPNRYCTQEFQKLVNY